MFLVFFFFAFPVFLVYFKGALLDTEGFPAGEIPGCRISHAAQGKEPQVPGHGCQKHRVFVMRMSRDGFEQTFILVCFKGFEGLFPFKIVRKHFRHVDVSWRFCIAENIDRMTVTHGNKCLPILYAFD